MYYYNFMKPIPIDCIVTVGQKTLMRGCDARLYIILLAEFLQGAEFQNNRSVIKAWTPHLSSALGISSLKLHCVFSYTQTAVWVWVWVVNISMPLRVELLNNYATVTVPIG